jgi:hypothetical protein
MGGVAEERQQRSGRELHLKEGYVLRLYV